MQDALEQCALQPFRCLDNFRSLGALQEFVFLEDGADEQSKGLQQLFLGESDRGLWGRMNRENAHYGGAALKGQM